MKTDPSNPDYDRFQLVTNRFDHKDKIEIINRLKLRKIAPINLPQPCDDPSDLPLNRINLEPINVCNYHCELCRTNLRDWVPRRIATIKDAEKIIAPIASGLRIVNLYGTRGEPLLHPQLEGFVSLLKASTAAKVRVTSNGSLVTESRARGLLDAGLDQIVFAIDGLDQRSYAAYRKGGNLKQVITNLKRFCELKSRGGYKTRVVFQFIPMAENEHQIPDLPEFAYGLGVDLVKLKTSTSVTNSEAYRSRNASYRPDLKRTAVFGCPQGLDNLYIDPNGYCYPCCYAEGYPHMMLGNATTESTDAIWNKPEFWELRRTFSDQNGFNELCLAKCYGVARTHKVILERPSI